MLIPFLTFVLLIPVLMYYFVMYQMYIIILHARIHSTLKRTNTYFMPTLFHNIGIGDYPPSPPCG